MAAEKEGAPNVQVFEMIVDITEQDERLLPGMSASVEVDPGEPARRPEPCPSTPSTPGGSAPSPGAAGPDGFEAVEVTVQERPTA